MQPTLISCSVTWRFQRGTGSIKTCSRGTGGTGAGSTGKNTGSTGTGVPKARVQVQAARVQVVRVHVVRFEAKQQRTSLLTVGIATKADNSAFRDISLREIVSGTPAAAFLGLPM
jgi:hypothetical protein